MSDYAFKLGVGYPFIRQHVLESFRIAWCSAQAGGVAHCLDNVGFKPS